MPRMDRTGPLGTGPIGRGLGPCGGGTAGWGRGRGAGRGGRFGWNYQPQQPAPEQEKALLEQQKSWLEIRLEEIMERLKGLSKE